VEWRRGWDCVRLQVQVRGHGAWTRGPLRVSGSIDLELAVVIHERVDGTAVERADRCHHRCALGVFTVAAEQLTEKPIATDHGRR